MGFDVVLVGFWHQQNSLLHCRFSDITSLRIRLFNSASDIWTYEAKLDGYRCLAAKGGHGIALWSRRGNSFKARFPEIARALEKLPANTLIDGEVVGLDSGGRVSFNALQHSRPEAYLQYYVFDILIHRGRKLLGFFLERRGDLLREALAKLQYPIPKSIQFEAQPEDIILAAEELGFEGIIAKRKGSVYESGRRSGAWLKYKINRSQEFVIGGYTPGNPFDALIVGVYDGAKLEYVAKVRNGFVPRMRQEVYERLSRVQSEQCPFSNLPEKRHYTLSRGAKWRTAGG